MRERGDTGRQEGKPSSRVRWLPGPVREAWERAAPSQRFGYRMRRGPVAYVIACMTVVWVLFAWTVTRRGMDGWLWAFVAVYAPATLAGLVTLMRWRAWVRLSAVVVDGNTLIWSNGVRWGRVELTPELAAKLLVEMDVDKRTGAVRLDVPGTGAPPLYLHRLVAYMERVGALTELLLERAAGAMQRGAGASPQRHPGRSSSSTAGGEENEP